MSEDNNDAPEKEGTRTSDLEEFQFILQETRVLLLQQILAHETGALSVEELSYRNADLSEENIRYHLRESEERGIVEGLEIPKGERKRDLPDTFFAVTKKGARLLRKANLLEELGVWEQVYDRMERTDRINKIENIQNRPNVDRGKDSINTDDTARVVDFPIGQNSELSENSSETGSILEDAINDDIYETVNDEPGLKEDSSDIPQITVVGCGSAGSNAIDRMSAEGIQGTKFVAANTDVQHLVDIEADTKILMGQQRTQGRGAGSLPTVGEEAALESQDEIHHSIEGSDIVILIAGLGGGTGTGSAPVVAKAAREQGALTIAIVTTPFTAEGEVRRTNAEAGLERLRDVADTVIVVPNDRLLDSVGKIPVSEAFKVSNEVLMRSVKGITELITKPGLVNPGFNDLRSIMETGGVSSIGLYKADSIAKVSDSVSSVPHSSFLSVDISNANSALVNVTGSPDMSIEEAEGIVEDIFDRIDPDTRIIWGTSIDEELEDEIQITVVAFGIEPTQITGGQRSDINGSLRQSDGINLDDELEY